MEKFLQHLQESEKRARTADHLIYSAFPLVQDKMIIINALVEAKKSVSSCINSILQYEYLFRRIRLYSDPNLNFQIFAKKCSGRYNISDGEISKIKELFDIVEKHRKSPAEFRKGDKVIILSENMVPEIISVEMVKKFVFLAKSLFCKAKTKMQECDKI